VFETEDKLAHLIALKGECDRLEHELAAELVQQAGYKKGDLVEDQSTGLWYEVSGAHGYFWLNEMKISLEVRRYWRSGRKTGKTARSTSHISASNLIKVERPA